MFKGVPRSAPCHVLESGNGLWHSADTTNTSPPPPLTKKENKRGRHVTANACTIAGTSVAVPGVSTYDKEIREAQGGQTFSCRQYLE